MNDHNIRGLDFYDPDKHLNPPITIVGVGGIGSWAALILAKMGFKQLTLYDPDKVEAHNVGCQLYGKMDIGGHKVASMTTLLQMQTFIKVRMVDTKYLETEPRGIVIATVDNMKDRRTIFTSCNFQGPDRVPLFIDCRIGGEKLLMYAVAPFSIEACSEYLKNWYPDKAASRLPCTGQNTAYIGALAGSLIAREVAKHCRDGGFSYSETIMDISTLQTLREETL